MLLAPVDLPDLSGVRSYRKQPAVDDKLNRGSLQGERIDAVTYVFENEGEVEIPSLSFSWWDAGSGEIRTETLDGLTIQVDADPNAIVESADPSTETSSGKRSGAWIAVLIGLAAVLVVFRNQIIAKIRGLRSKYEATEYAHFRRFVAASKTGKPDAVLRSLVYWWDAADEQSRAPRLDQFVAQFGTPALDRELETLEIAVDSNDAAWRSDGFVGHVREARKSWLSAKRNEKASKDDVLPPLYG